MGLRLNPVLLFVSPEFAVICAAPTPVSEHAASALAANTRTPTPSIGYVAITNDGHLPVIGYVALALSIIYDGPAPLIKFMVPAPGASLGGRAPVTEYVAPFPGASDDGPSLDIDDLTRYLNDLKEPGICLPAILDLESRVAALRQARGH